MQLFNRLFNLEHQDAEPRFLSVVLVLLTNCNPRSDACAEELVKFFSDNSVDGMNEFNDLSNRLLKSSSLKFKLSIIEFDFWPSSVFAMISCVLVAALCIVLAHVGHSLGSAIGDTIGELSRDLLVFLGRGGDKNGVIGDPMLCVRLGEGRIGLTFAPNDGEASKSNVRSEDGLNNLLQSE